MLNMLAIRAKSFALVLVLLFNLAATAETVTEFQQDGIAKEEVTLVFEESDSDDDQDGDEGSGGEENIHSSAQGGFG